MIWLVALAVVVTMAAVWYVARPLWATAGVVAREEHQELLQVRTRLLAQLSELDMEAGDRNMDAAVVSDERARLETELTRVLHEIDRAGVVSAPVRNASGTSSKVLIATFAVALPLIAVGLYGVNNYATLTQLTAMESPAAESIPPMVLEMVARLENRLKEQPNDAHGWARLGRAYQVLGRSEEGKQAYGRAYKLAPDDTEVMSGYASALMLENPAQPSTEAVALFRKVYARDPRHTGALWVLGLVAYNDGKFAMAAKHWQELLSAVPPGSDIEPEIRHAIEQAKSQAK